jgi:hypothetical protein
MFPESLARAFAATDTALMVLSTAEKSVLEKDLTMAFIDFDVDMLRRYLKETERLLQSAKKREISAYRERLQLEGKAHREEAEVDMQAIREHHDQFARFQRYAFLMLTFTIFEARAKVFCEYVRDHKKLSLKVGDLQGNLPEKLKLYLCRYAKVLDEGWQLWGDMRKLQLIRHQIAHQGGICSEAKAKELKALAQNIPGLRLESDIEGFLIELNLGTCRYAVSTIAHFFEEAGRRAGFRNGG